LTLAVALIGPGAVSSIDPMFKLENAGYSRILSNFQQ
jgi:hypothetical protein